MGKGKWKEGYGEGNVKAEAEGGQLIEVVGAVAVTTAVAGAGAGGAANKSIVAMISHTRAPI